MKTNTTPPASNSGSFPPQVRGIKGGASGFTLVELIVVITILAILGTIAFLSLQGYSRDARNSKRTSELEMIEKSLALFYTNKGFYPDSNNPTNITYSGTLAWSQGTFGANQNQQLGSISKLPLDPLTQTEYTYSTTSTKNEYQLGAVYEGLITQNQNNKTNKNQEILNKTYAGNQDGIAKVTGNYNGTTLTVYNGTTLYILAVPTIINGDLGLTDLQTIIGSGKLVYNGGNTLPGNYTGTVFDTTKTNTYFTKTGTMLVYSGTMDQLRTNETARIQMLKNLQDAYSGTTVGQTDGNIKPILDTTINTSTPTQQAKDFAVGILTNNLKIRLTQINNSNPTIAPACNYGEILESGICKDPYFNNVSLLLHMDGTNGSTNFIDQAGTQITAYGNVKISTSQSKFGGASATFDGNGDYLSLPSINSRALGTGDFTVETWVMLNGGFGGGLTSDKLIFGGYTYPHMLFFLTNDSFTPSLRDQSQPNPASLGILPNIWTHIAWSRKSGVLKIFINGVQKLSVNENVNFIGTSPITIGGTAGDSRYLSGYIDDIRVTKGIARYTADFTPPTFAFPNQNLTPETTNTTCNPGEILYNLICKDPYWGSVSLLMHMDGTNGSTSFIDQAGTQITAYGDVKISTTQSKFGGASATFDGNWDYLSLPSINSRALGTGDFTVEAWINSSTGFGGGVNNDKDIFGGFTSPAMLFFLTNDNLTPALWDGTAQRTASSPVLSNTWTHVAWSRSSGILKIFIDGVEKFSVAHNINFTGTFPVSIGGTAGSSRYLSGYVDEIRVTKGFSRYTTNFTPQTFAFPNQ